MQQPHRSAVTLADRQKASDLHQRRSMTVMRLVHNEVVTGQVHLRPQYPDARKLEAGLTVAGSSSAGPPSWIKEPLPLACPTAHAQRGVLPRHHRPEICQFRLCSART